MTWRIPPELLAFVRDNYGGVEGDIPDSVLHRYLTGELVPKTPL